MTNISESKSNQVIAFWKSFEVKASGLHLSFSIFDSPPFIHTIKRNCMKLVPSWSRDLCKTCPELIQRLLIQRYAQFWFFRKEFGTSFSTLFYVRFFKKNISHIIFYSLTGFYCLTTFTSWNIWQYLHCNCLLTRLWRHKCWD